jgi:acylphosphatase
MIVLGINYKKQLKKEGEKICIRGYIFNFI